MACFSYLKVLKNGKAQKRAVYNIKNYQKYDFFPNINSYYKQLLRFVKYKWESRMILCQSENIKENIIFYQWVINEHWTYRYVQR